MKKKVKEEKPSKKLGDMIDSLHRFDENIRTIEASLKKLKSKRFTMEMTLLGQMQDGKLKKAAGSRALAFISKREIPTIKDQRAFQKYVKKHGAFDLYQNRVATKAWKARLDDGEAVPGIEIFKKVSVSIRKRG